MHAYADLVSDYMYIGPNVGKKTWYMIEALELSVCFPYGNAVSYIGSGHKGQSNRDAAARLGRDIACQIAHTLTQTYLKRRITRLVSYCTRGVFSVKLPGAYSYVDGTDSFAGLRADKRPTVDSLTFAVMVTECS